MDTTILNVDDSAINRRLVRELLEDEGYAVVDAANGAEALELLAPQAGPKADQAWGLVISDVHMPVLGGIGLLKAVRRAAALAGLPVLLVSGDHDDLLRAAALAAGADGWLEKPYEIDSLTKAVRRVLSGGQVSVTRRPGQALAQAVNF